MRTHITLFVLFAVFHCPVYGQTAKNVRPLTAKPGEHWVIRWNRSDDFSGSSVDWRKWHLGFKNGKNDWQAPLRPGPQDLGFDYYFGIPVVSSAPPYVWVENDHIVGGDPSDPSAKVECGADHDRGHSEFPCRCCLGQGNGDKGI